MRHKWKHILTDNLSYKVVSLFIALILWLTILGRRDFSLTKSVEVELLPGPQQTVSAQSAENVKVKVTGPRAALKKFMESGMSQMVSIDVSKKGEGDIELEVPIKQIDVPFGVKVISVKPSVIRARILKKD
ncbi:MAG: CdaR family protein [Pseudobdellovibrionaceae bacterium]